jgi:hypothetical protein
LPVACEAYRPQTVGALSPLHRSFECGCSDARHAASSEACWRPAVIDLPRLPAKSAQAVCRWRARRTALRRFAPSLRYSVRSNAGARTPVTPFSRNPAGDQTSSTSRGSRLRRLSPCTGGVRGVPPSGGSHPSKHNVQRVCARRREVKPTRSSCVRLAHARAPGSRLLHFCDPTAA